MGNLSLADRFYQINGHLMGFGEIVLNQIDDDKALLTEDGLIRLAHLKPAEQLNLGSATVITRIH